MISHNQKIWKKIVSWVEWGDFYKLNQVSVWIQHIVMLCHDGRRAQSHVSSFNLPEVKGGKAERVRDNSIKVLASEKKEEVAGGGAQVCREKLRSNSFTLQENTHQHFCLSARWIKLDFQQPWLELQTRCYRALKTCWGGTGSRKYRKQEVPPGAQGSTSDHNTFEPLYVTNFDVLSSS